MAISDAEAVQLARIRDAEADFYAEVLFLALARINNPSRMNLIADAVISAFTDMNKRVIS